MTEKPFEIPQQMRDLAKKNMEQASAVFGQFIDAVTHASNISWKTMPANEMNEGFRAIQEQATKYAKENAEAGLALASSLAKATDIQEVLAIHGRFAQSQMQAYTVQALELGRLIGRATQRIRPGS